MRRIALVVIWLFASTARADDWSVKRDPFDVRVAVGYEHILGRDPHDERALSELVSLYRRYRTVAKLEAEYRAKLDKVAGDAQWAALVVLARLPRAAGADTIALWQRALEAKSDDARGWIAYGDLVADHTVSQNAFRAAAKCATNPAQKRSALTKLLRTAIDDPAVTEVTYAALIEIASERELGKLWLDRGDAQLAGGRAADAAKSYANAASHLADPVMRLTAMMNVGVALARDGHPDEAIAQFELTIDRMPRGYYLREEVVHRIVGIERARWRLAEAITRLETRWPERSRGHLEWSTLALLYLETTQDEKALAAYRRAVALAPTEVGTQRELIALLDRLRPDEALAQHEAAARLAPGDATIQLELAKRYREDQPRKSLATLATLTTRVPDQVSARQAIARLYKQWGETKLEIREYEAIASLEPRDVEHVVTLGEAYWTYKQRQEARRAWARLEQLDTAPAHYRHGEMLTTHGLYAAAIVAYTKSLARDATNIEALCGRANAYDEVGQHAGAVADAFAAVALKGLATHGDRQRERFLLACALGGKRYVGNRQRDPHPQLLRAAERWRVAFHRGDASAGYLLAAYLVHAESFEHHELIVELYERVPTDDSLGIEVATSYRKLGDLARARQLLSAIARRAPTRQQAIGELLAQIDLDEARANLDDGWSAWERSVVPPTSIDSRRSTRRLGVRLGLGADVRETSRALLGVGVYRMHGVTRGTAIATRIDWTQRDGQMEAGNAFAFGFGINQRVADAGAFELAVGLAASIEARYGPDTDIVVAGDATLELVPRALPASIGLRFHQPLSDESHRSTLVFELGFELR